MGSADRQPTLGRLQTATKLGVPQTCQHTWVWLKGRLEEGYRLLRRLRLSQQCSGMPPPPAMGIHPNHLSKSRRLGFSRVQQGAPPSQGGGGLANDVGLQTPSELKPEFPFEPRISKSLGDRIAQVTWVCLLGSHLQQSGTRVEVGFQLTATPPPEGPVKPTTLWSFPLNTLLPAAAITPSR